MNKATAKCVLTDLLCAYAEDVHGDYFYDHGDEVCEAVKCILREQSQWISVEERLPEDLVWVQVYRAANQTMDTDFCTPSRKSGWHHYSDITHWMPLPEPPEVEV